MLHGPNHSIHLNIMNIITPHVCVCYVYQFKVNEFGVLEVLTEEGDDERVKKSHATTTWAVPTVQEGKMALFNVHNFDMLPTGIYL